MVEKGKRSDWAERYNDTPLNEIPWELGRPKDVVVELMESGLISKGSRVLDIGCGAGSNTVFISGAGYNVIGLDFVPLALKHSIELAEENSLEIPFTAADAAYLPFRSSVFDLIIDLGCFHCMAEGRRGDYIDEVSRVIRPGGFIQLTCFNKKGDIPEVASSFDEADIRTLFSRNFEIEDVKDYDGESRLGEIMPFFTFLMKKKA